MKMEPYQILEEIQQRGIRPDITDIQPVTIKPIIASAWDTGRSSYNTVQTYNFLGQTLTIWIMEMLG